MRHLLHNPLKNLLPKQFRCSSSHNPTDTIIDYIRYKGIYVKSRQDFTYGGCQVIPLNQANVTFQRRLVYYTNNRDAYGGIIF